MNKIILLFLGFFLLSSLAQAGGDAVNNGGGLGEKNFIYAFRNLHDFIGPCLNINPCQLTEKEDHLLRQISSNLSYEQENAQLVFKSGIQDPGFFEVDLHGQPRIAVTSSQPGTPIYINLDLLYRNENGVTKTLSVLEASAILVHELGHHYGIKDHLFLDKLGAKIQSQREPYLEQINLQKFRQDKFVLKAYNHSFRLQEYPSLTRHLQGRLTLENGFELIDLTPQIVKVVACPHGYKINAVHFSNMHWEKKSVFDLTRQTQRLDLLMDFDFQCQSLSPRDLSSPEFFQTLRISGDFKIKVINSIQELQDPHHFEVEEWIFYPETILNLVPESLQIELRP